MSRSYLNGHIETVASWNLSDDTMALIRRIYFDNLLMFCNDVHLVGDYSGLPLAAIPIHLIAERDMAIRRIPSAILAVDARNKFHWQDQFAAETYDAFIGLQTIQKFMKTCSSDNNTPLHISRGQVCHIMHALIHNHSGHPWDTAGYHYRELNAYLGDINEYFEHPTQIAFDALELPLLIPKLTRCAFACFTYTE